jgi:hypothetical protein
MVLSGISSPVFENSAVHFNIKFQFCALEEVKKQ